MLWGGWGERKRERAGHDGKGEERRREKREERREAPAVSLFPSSPARFLFLSIIDILIGIPSGSLCGGERPASQSFPFGFGGKKGRGTGFSALAALLLGPF